MSKTQDMQRFLRYYREVTGKTEIDMKEVAKMAVEQHGWPLPPPLDPIDRVAQDFSRAAREQTMVDGMTGKAYRVNHAVSTGQGTFWIEIDTASRKNMKKASQQKRDQDLGSIYQNVLDLEHWSRVHPTEEPLTTETDFTFDVELRRHVSDDEKAS